MKSTVTISELQAQAPKCVRRAEQEGALTIARHGRAVAFLVSRDRMEALIESLAVVYGLFPRLLSEVLGGQYQRPPAPGSAGVPAGEVLLSPRAGRDAGA